MPLCKGLLRVNHAIILSKAYRSSHMPIAATSAHPAAATQPASPRRRPSQGELVERALEQAPPSLGLVDIGVNLSDHSFDKVLHLLI